MRNLHPIQDPRQHFATFWKERNPDGRARAAQLRQELKEVASHIEEGDLLTRCSTVELLPPLPETTLRMVPAASKEETGAPSKVPGTYWVVPGDLLELALLAYELVDQERENERLEDQRLKEKRARPFDENAH